MGLENAELVQIASVARKEIGTAGMSALGLELRQMSQGTKIPARHRDCWTTSQPEYREHRDTLSVTQHESKKENRN